MKSATVNIDESQGRYYAFYSVPAILSHDKEREIGTAESKDRLIIVDDEIKREHVYIIPQTKVEHHGDKQVYIGIHKDSLKDFQM
jgi:hypothetical protein